MSPSKAATMGFLVAPLVAAIVSAALSPITGGDIGAKIGLVPIFYVFALAASGFLGLPTFLVLRHFGLINWRSSLVVGAVIGAIVAVILRFPSAVEPGDFQFLVPMGTVFALCFWACWRLGQEHRE